MLRCIYCSRGTNKVTLSGSFTCIDKAACKRYVNVVVKINFDAACMGANAAGGCPLGIGIYVEVDGVRAPEWCGTKAVKWGSVNDGEYIAMICALYTATRMLKHNHKYIFRVWGDSQIAINGYNGVNKAAPKFKKYLDKLDELKTELGRSLQYVRWTSRNGNKNADILSKEALKLHAL